ncbi:carboxymuconolactone decarboxylase family protein [Streptomyces sp. NPDC020379]|uniref:carboxymuconolactone decarboxylase family protein n=1 Tax=Streptomyces sp. NPDC020379 TaxID=3365071 RepID=UPI003796E10D
MFAGEPPLNLFTTLAHHPALLGSMTPLFAQLSDGLLPSRDRELVILRLAWRKQCRYEWAHHVRIASLAGVTAKEIAGIPQAAPSRAWNEFDAALLGAVDELCEPNGVVSESVWRCLEVRYDAGQMLELLVLTGMYAMAAGLLNSCATPTEAWMPDPAPLPPSAA